MTSFEILTIILSAFALIISLSAFIISIIKSINERKAYKKQFIIDNLIKLRTNLNMELTALDQLNPEISMALIFNRIEKNEKFDYYNEILKLNNATSIIISNALILLSSYKATKCNANLMKVLNNILTDSGTCFQIVIKNKDNRFNLIKEYLEYKKVSLGENYVNCKFDILIELSNTIKHLMNDDITDEELNSYFIQFELKGGRKT